MKKLGKCRMLCQTLFVKSKSLELFLTDLLTEAIKVAEENGKNKLTGSCLKKVIDQKDHLKFLKSITDNFPDIENEQKKKPAKKGQKDEEKVIEKTKKKIKKEDKYEDLSE